MVNLTVHKALQILHDASGLARMTKLDHIACDEAFELLQNHLRAGIQGGNEQRERNEKVNEQSTQ